MLRYHDAARLIAPVFLSAVSAVTPPILRYFSRLFAFFSRAAMP